MIKNKVFLMVIVIFLHFFNSCSINKIAKSYDIERLTSAQSMITIEASSGRVLYAKNEHQKLPMASTTKIMTGILAIERFDLKEVVEIPKEATNIEGSSVYLSEGDKITMEDLLYSLLLASANDAACAIAYAVAGDISEFSGLMNSKAAELGLDDTHFDNPHGLDSDTHYTTAKDLARLTSYALRNNTFKQIVSTYAYSFYIGEKPRILTNHNKLLKSCDDCIGVKTGYTSKSGRCLVSASTRNDITLIAVTLDDPNDWKDHKDLYSEGFSSLTSIKIGNLIDPTLDIPLLGGAKDYLIANVDYKSDEIVVLLSPEEKVDVCFLYNKFIIAPISNGDIIGEAVIKVDGNAISRYNIIAAEDIKPTKNKFSIFI